MAGYTDFREVVAWQLAHQMKIRVDVFLGCPDFRRYFTFCEQLSDAARSGPRNIAEGHGRFKHKEFAELVRIARASEAAVLNHLIEAHDQRLISADELQINEQLAKRAIKAASGLIRYLESTPDPPQSGGEESHSRSDQSPQAGVPPPGAIGDKVHDQQRADAADDAAHRFPGAGAPPEQGPQHRHEQRRAEQRIEDAQCVDDRRELDREDHPEHAAG